MFSVVVNKEIGRIILETDDPSVKYMFEAFIQEEAYCKTGKILQSKYIHIYEGRNQARPDATGKYTFVFNYGWCSYLLRLFKNYLSVTDYNGLVRLLVSDSVRTIPFPNLRDYQNEDVLHLLKYKVGLFSCYTGYGLSLKLKLNK